MASRGSPSSRVSHRIVRGVRPPSEIKAPYEGQPNALPASRHKYRRWRIVRMFGIIASCVGIGVSTYLIGASRGVDVQAARLAGTAEGARKGQALGSQAGFASTFKPAREHAYDAAYERAYRTAYVREFEQAGLSPPSIVRVRRP
jgi:hypothetical protein